MKTVVTAWAVALAFVVPVVTSTDAQAGSDSWADVTDVSQYVPLGFALADSIHQEDLEGLVQLTLAGALTLGTTELLKNEIDAERPNYKPGDGQNSFPSGHVAKAWFAAAHVQKRYGCYQLEWECWRASSIPYLAAGVTAYGRVTADRHHWEDVLASAVIAETFVYFTTDKFDPSLSVTANFENGFGVVMFKRF